MAAFQPAIAEGSAPEQAPHLPPAAVAGRRGLRVLPVLGGQSLCSIGGLGPVGAAVVLRWLLPESPRFLARQQSRWPELESVLGRMGHQVAPGTQFVDLTDRTVGKATVSTLFTPEYRRDTIALWCAFFSCLLAVYLGFSWLTSLLTSAGFDPATANSGITAFNLGGVVGALVGGVAIARFGSRAAMLTMAAIAIVGAAGLSTMTISPAVAESLTVAADFVIDFITGT